LWLYVDKIYQLGLRYDNSQDAIEERKRFLIQHQIGVCDIVESAEREKIDASDLGMTNIKLRDVISYLKQYPNIDTLLFTGGSSKNGPEYFFRQHLKEYTIKLNVVSNKVPRIHEFVIPNEAKASVKPNRIIKTVSLTSASGSANRAIGSMPLYQQLKNSNPKFNTFDFRVMQYQEFF
jgi:G:T/U-mismatch repair DNA glycosylase